MSRFETDSSKENTRDLTKTVVQNDPKAILYGMVVAKRAEIQNLFERETSMVVLKKKLWLLPTYVMDDLSKTSILQETERQIERPDTY